VHVSGVRSGDPQPRPERRWGDEAHCTQRFPLKFARATAADLHEGLAICGAADRNNEPAADGELLLEGAGNLRGAGGDEDSLERRGRRPAQGAIANAQGNVVIAEGEKPLSRRISERTMALDGMHAVRNAAHDCGRIPRAGADLQHAIAAAEFGRLDHQCDDVRLRNGLAFANRQRTIVIG
jgi:hypothetical protein